MTDCLCNVGRRCVAPGCDKCGERDGAFPDSAVPGAAWCLEHGTAPPKERIALWQQRVMEQEERDHAAP